MSNLIKETLKTLKVTNEILVETEKNMLVGCLHFVDVNFNYIQLSSVTDLKLNLHYTSVQRIPVKFIKCIKLVKEDENSSTSGTENTTKSDSSYESLHSNNKVNKGLPEIMLTPYELQLMQKQIDSVQILSSRGPAYITAITDIKARSFIALHVEPFQSGRNRKTAVITMATEDSVYLFDIISLGKLFEDLKAILKAERPCKAIHNSHLVSDHFQYRQNIYLEGISDTFVAFCIVSKEKQNLDLESVVEKYFGISKDFFGRREEYDSHQMYTRPLDQGFVRHCARRAVFIYKLNEYLQKHMLRTYYTQCKNFSRTFADNEDSSEVANSIEKNDSSGHECIQALDLRHQSL